MKYEIHTDLPFLAVCDDKPGGYFEPTMTTYLVNPLSEPLHDVTSTTGGSYSFDEETIQGNGRARKIAVIAPGAYGELETSTSDELDEFELWWTVQYEIAGEKCRVDFGASKGLRDAQYVDSLPILGKPGTVIPRGV